MGERVWTNKEEAQLIRLYSNARCLWDREHPSYADESKRRCAHDIIADSLDNEFSVPEVVEKIQELRGQYLKELKKESRRRSGKHFIYRWVHLERMEFLRSAVTADEREQAPGDVTLLRPGQGVPGGFHDTPDDDTKGTAFPDLSSHAGESTGSSRKFFSVPAPMMPEVGRFPDQRQPAEGLDPIVDESKYAVNVPATQLLPVKAEHDLLLCENQERQSLQEQQQHHTEQKTPPHVDTMTHSCSSPNGQGASTAIGSPNPEAGPKRTHFDAHVRSHTGEKPYACDWPNCGGKFARSGTLKRHYYKHTGERRYLCDRCGRTFYRNEHLLGHLKTHKSE